MINEYFIKGLLVALACMAGLFILGVIIKLAAVKLNLMKPCPHCSELILPDADTCKHCHRSI